MHAETQLSPAPTLPAFKQILGHPAPLWMLFMTEFWERFAFYGMRWALVLYIVTQFYEGAGSGELPASLIYGSYLALVYAGAIFGGYVADRIIGYQRAILVGAVFMAAGLFMIAIPDRTIFQIGLATVIVGNGMFKPNISAMVGQLYDKLDARRDSGFTIFYVGVNAGALIAPVLTQFLAQKIFGDAGMPAYKVVFIASGLGMLISLLWFSIGRHALKGIGAADPQSGGMRRVALVVVGASCVIPIVYSLFALGAQALQMVLSALFLGVAAMLLVEGIRGGRVARDRVIAMLIIFVFNILFWMFFEQAGSSFNFLGENIVNRSFGAFVVPNAWFQSVESIGIIVLGPVLAALWVWLGRRGANPSIAGKFGLGLVFNGLAFGLLMYALSQLVGADHKIPFWTLFMVYIIQSVAELCLSPIGLSMVTKLAPARLVGLGMGGWFLSMGIGDNFSGIFAAAVSGESGMSVVSALNGYAFGFWSLLGAGVVLLLLARVITRLMHGVK